MTSERSPLETSASVGWEKLVRHSAHALNNHLGAAQLLLELLAKSLPKDPALQEDVKEVLRNIHSASEIVDAMRRQLPREPLS